MRVRYRHTQVGWLILISLGISLVALAVVTCLALDASSLAVSAPAGASPGSSKSRPEVPVLLLAAVFALIAICMVLFSSLTVTVTNDAIEIRFGPGLIRKKFALADIASCRIVRNRWYYGWGIRKIPGGWLYNVSGLDAVELRMSSGRTYRIGTDEPRELRDAVQRALSEAKLRH